MSLMIVDWLEKLPSGQAPKIARYVEKPKEQPSLSEWDFRDYTVADALMLGLNAPKLKEATDIHINPYSAARIRGFGNPLDRVIFTVHGSVRVVVDPSVKPCTAIVINDDGPQALAIFQLPG